MKKYAVIFGQTATGWSAYVPDLPGLAATGPSFEKTEQRMREALDMHLGSMREDGDVIPEATTRVLMVEVPGRQLAKSA